MPEGFFTAEKTSKEEFMARDWPREIQVYKNDGAGVLVALRFI